MQARAFNSTSSASSIHAKAKYSTENLQKALVDIKQGTLTAYRAHKTYSIPQSTLSRHLSKKDTKSIGSDTVLTNSEEEMLADWILLCSKAGNPKTKSEILSAAGELASIRDGKQFKKGIPGRDWMKSFVQRHPNISKRTPQSIGKASANVTVDGLRRFFEKVRIDFEQSGDISTLYERPEAWWNADETSFLFNPSPKSVYAAKGSKTVHNVERGKPKENLTCTYAVAADGNHIPPLITFKESFSRIVEAAYVSGSK